MAPSFCRVECKICGMASIGGLSWLRSHRCPEPFPLESAQAIWDSLTASGTIVSPRIKARLVMSWRYGYIKTRDDRVIELMEQQFHRPIP